VHDFKTDNNLVFLTPETLSAWLDQQVTIKINKNIYDISYKYPYLFQDLIGNIYIVQNVQGNTYEAAVYLSYYWKKHKTNLGYYVNANTETVKTTLRPTIYKPILLSKYNKNIGHFEVIENGMSAYKLLNYNYNVNNTNYKNGSFAALLPIF
jgi:hypothetical protein